MSRDQPVYVPPLCLQDVDLSSIGLFYICAAVVSAAGIDMDRFKPHSTRSASTSWAAHKEVSVDKIMAAAGWRSSNYFAQFYKRPITDRSKDFDWALLHSINTP